MGVFHPFDVVCPNCDGHYSVSLPNTVNVVRFPHLKQQILDRTLNCGLCKNCGYTATIELPFLYVDIGRGLHISVYPRKERHFEKKASEETTVLLSSFSKLRVPQPRAKRVVFGLEELREKIVAVDAELDDRKVELLKLYVIKEHPFLIQKRRMRITLDCVLAQKVDFDCSHDHDKSAFKVSVPRAFYDALLVDQSPPAPGARPRRLPEEPFADGEDAPWINLWKLNPSNDALAQLSRFAEAVRRGESIDIVGDDFARMVKTLPRGNQLSSWAKRDLQTLADYARMAGRSAVEDDLFEVRFGFELDDDWFKNSDLNDVKTIWTLLKNLPDIAVEGNSWIRVINLDLSTNQGGGYYDPTAREISIGSGLQSQSLPFRNVVLHEVGHATHEMLDRTKKSLVSKWLTANFGWQILDITTAGIDAWIAAMGGYPPGTTTQEKNQVRAYIQQSVGPGGSFNAAAIVSGPTGHLWNKKEEFGPRRAFEKTGGYWWDKCDQWHVAKGKKFFVNYYYMKLMIIDEAAVRLVVQDMPDRYATMSHYEYFAELFAWFYDGQSPKRDKIPGAVSAWFIQNIGPLDTSSPYAPSRPEGARASSPRTARKRQVGRGSKPSRRR